MREKAALKSHEAMALRDMIQKDCDTINKLIDIVCKLKDYTNQLGQIEALRERLQSIDFWISKLQMRASTQI